MKWKIWYPTVDVCRFWNVNSTLVTEVSKSCVSISGRMTLHYDSTLSKKKIITDTFFYHCNVLSRRNIIEWFHKAFVQLPKTIIFFYKSLQVVKIKHHRGPVSALQVSTASDVLVSSSHDTTICLWSLEDFTLLNTIQLNGPIFNIQISSDSVSFSSNVCFL